MIRSGNNFEKVGRTSLPDQIIRQIQQMIERGHLKPNDKLPSERELTQMLGVSRLPLREALKSLQAINVLEVRPGEGYFVHGVEIVRILDFFEGKHEPGSSMFNDLKEARMIMELGAVELACAKRTEADIIRLKQSNERMKKAVEENSESVLRYASEFHNNIFEASRNGFFISLLACMDNSLQENRDRLSEAQEQGLYLSYKAHQEILEAIIARDAEKARALLKQHLQTRSHLG